MSLAASLVIPTTADNRQVCSGVGASEARALAGALILGGLPVVLQDGTYSYVYGLGLISQTDNSGNQSYFLGNGLGSTEALVDGTLAS